MTLIGPAVPATGTDLDTLRNQWRALAELDDPAVVIELLPEPSSCGEGPLARAGFAVKGNIDIAGTGTTAGLSEVIRYPADSAPVVRRLAEAGATPLATTNLDQLATGLVGTRSPWGTPLNPVDPTSVPGGSSSGSAVSVARGLVPFALGTDTAGSGRVPAALTRSVGFKPTLGWLPINGVVPAIPGLDTVSVHALCVHDAWTVVLAAAGFEKSDPWSRQRPDGSPASAAVVIGTLSDHVLNTTCDPATATAHRVAMSRLRDAGFDIRHLDLELWFDVARGLYGGPWVAARDAAFGHLIDERPKGLDPTVASIVRGSRGWTGADAYRATTQLAEWRRRSDEWWSAVDLLALPTVPFRPSLEDVTRDPVGVNERLGTFTNAANLLDWAAPRNPDSG